MQAGLQHPVVHKISIACCEGDKRALAWLGKIKKRQVAESLQMAANVFSFDAYGLAACCCTQRLCGVVCLKDK